MKFRLTILFSFFCVFSITAQTARFSDRAGVVGYSARAISMGNSNFVRYQQSLDGLNNPSLLSSFNSTYSLSYNHTNTFGGITNLDQLLFIYKRDSVSRPIGISIHQLSNSQVFDTRKLITNAGSVDFDALSLLSNNDYSIKLMFSRKPQERRVKMGFELNFDMLSVTSFTNAVALGLDYGLSYSINARTSYALSVDNILGKYYYWSQDTTQLESSYFSSGNYIRSKSMFIQLPFIQNGFDYELLQANNIGLHSTILVSLGFGRESNSLYGTELVDWLNINGALGFELDILKKIYFRGSVSSFEQIEVSGVSNLVVSPSLGVGIDIKGINLDYAWGDFNNKVIPLQKHIISMSYRKDNAKNNSNISSNKPTRI